MIFEDRTGRRRRRATWGALLLVLVLALPVLMFVAGREVAPRFPGRPAEHASALPGPAPLAEIPAGAPARARLVFAAHEDPPGARSIEANHARIDAIVTDWFRLPGSGCVVEETVDAASRGWAAQRGADAPRVVARLANLRDDAWVKSGADTMLASPETRRCVARTVASRAQALGARGLNVDLESLAPASADGLVAFLAELRTALPPGDHLSIDVTPDDPSHDLVRLGAIADAVVLMAYDEHEESSGPGAPATPRWFGDVVDHALAAVPRERLVVGLGSYCYDWTTTAPRRAEALTYPAAVERARAAAALPAFQRGAGGAMFRYAASGASHEVWCGDGAAVHNQLLALRARGIDGWALWRAGSEDPSLWPVTAATTPAEVALALSDLRAERGATVEGEGEAWSLVAPPAPGRREVVLDGDGAVRTALTRSFPTGHLFRRLGGPSRREVVLTFDDGPDARSTPIILDALRAQSAPATFFVLGEQAIGQPALVQRIAREGHLLGNHTFHHPHVDQIDEAELLRELQATERVLEGELGRYSPLFRAPYTAAFDARDPDLLASHLPAFASGYTVVGAAVDPADWSAPGAEVIADRIVAGVEQGGRIVVLHDGGGDRAQTAAALGIAIPRLRALGYAIVPLDRHLGKDRDAIAGPIDARDEAISTGARAASVLSSHGPALLRALFGACTTIAAIRVLLLLVLALRRRRAARRDVPGAASTAAPLVTVLVPAFNEEKVLRATVRSLLASDHPRIEVLVIDDGSTDGTFAVAAALAAEDPRVRCLGKVNGGKAAAANHGIRHARGEIVVSVDADTIVARDAIRHLVGRLADPAVSAVCGNVEVGNVRSALTAFQAIEYVTSQNLDRAALAELNAIPVVPGALGAWRRDVLLAAGGYAHDTLVEDADLTLTVLRAGGRIEYEPRAVARTEAPETLAALWKQRFRWTYGTYQCLAKHRAGLLRGKGGWIALPNLLVFQVIFPLLSPVGDAVMILALACGNGAALLPCYLGFLGLDLVASVVAFRLDGKPLPWLALLLVQRFTYRQLMVLVCARAVLAAVAGRRHGWRKLARTGAVELVAGGSSFDAAREASVVEARRLDADPSSVHDIAA